MQKIWVSRTTLNGEKKGDGLKYEKYYECETNVNVRKTPRGGGPNLMSFRRTLPCTPLRDRIILAV